MKKNLRSLTALVLTFCMVFALSACVGSPVKNGSNDNGGEKKSKQDPGVIKIDNCEAVYKGFEIKKDSDDEDALVVKWDFTNNGDEEESFGWSINPSFYQDGVELKYAVVWESEDSFDALDDDIYTEVQKGSTIEVMTTYKLKNLESAVDVKCESILGDDKSEFKIDIKK